MATLRDAITLEGRCRRCLAELPEGRVTYCSDRCMRAVQRHRSRKRKRAPEPGVSQAWVGCPRPDKGRFNSERSAQRELALRPGHAHVQPYLCQCGWWHLGRPGSD